MTNSTNSVAPILIFGYGNPSRGDDALGPMMLEQIGKRPDIELLTDFQLQVEHSLDMVGRDLILFIDASESCPDSNPAPFQFLQLDCNKEAESLGYTTHTLAPTELITAYHSVHHCEPPPSFLLTIRGEQYELGSALSDAAQDHLQQAQKWLKGLLNSPSLQHWQRALQETPQQVA